LTEKIITDIEADERNMIFFDQYTWFDSGAVTGVDDSFGKRPSDVGVIDCGTTSEHGVHRFA
jgi:hypothetical protein